MMLLFLQILLLASNARLKIGLFVVPRLAAPRATVLRAFVDFLLTLCRFDQQHRSGYPSVKQYHTGDLGRGAKTQ